MFQKQIFSVGSLELRLSLIVYYSILEFIYSMKRKSANQIDYPQPARSLKRNNSCIINQLAFNRSKEKRKNRPKQFVSAATVVELLINEWLYSLDDQLHASDQKQFHQRMISQIDLAVSALSGMLSPISAEQQTCKSGNAAEPQPHPVAADLFCGGNSIACDTKAAKMPRMSISIGLEECSKPQRGQITYSKSNISSKCLIKLPKEQLLERRQGLEALKQGQPEKRDVFEEILRDKFMKDKKSLYFHQEKLEAAAKQNTLPSIQEYSFDYDGTVLPLKKNSIQTSHRIKILNTTCKILNRDYIQNRKQSVIGKLQGAHLRTQMQEVQKENKRYGEALKRGLSQRKPSKTDSVRELLRICTESDELTLKAKIEESIGSKSVKLRQIKAH